MSPTATRPNDDVLFKILADQTRRDILQLLRHRRYSVGELAANFHVSRPAVSKHLRLLRTAGLVRDIPQGAATLCELNAEPLIAVDAWLSDYKRFWNNKLTRLKAHVEKRP